MLTVESGVDTAIPEVGLLIVCSDAVPQIEASHTLSVLSDAFEIISVIPK